MLLFSARILADFTQETLLVWRLPRELRQELRTPDLGSTAHEDLGNRRTIELLLEWMCRAQDIGTDGQVSAGFDPIHGWEGPAPLATQLAALRFFIAAAELTGDGVYRRRARRIAEAFVPVEDSSTDEQLTHDIELFPASSTPLERATILRMRTAAQQLFGLGSYRKLLAMARSVAAIDINRETEPLAVLATCRAFFELSWVTRDASFVDRGLTLLASASQLLAERTTGIAFGVTEQTELCEALLDGFELSAQNRLLHEAAFTIRPLLTAAAIQLRGTVARGVTGRTAIDRLLRPLPHSFQWMTTDLAALLRCVSRLRSVRHLRAAEVPLEQGLLHLLRGSLLCSTEPDVNGSLAVTVPAKGDLHALSRSTLSASMFGTELLREAQLRARQSRVATCPAAAVPVETVRQ